jgi:hypothetical protein
MDHVSPALAAVDRPPVAALAPQPLDDLAGFGRWMRVAVVAVQLPPDAGGDRVLGPPRSQELGDRQGTHRLIPQVLAHAVIAIPAEVDLVLDGLPAVLPLVDVLVPSVHDTGVLTRDALTAALAVGLDPR